MRFADIENIWLENLNGLSNVDKGRVYYERAKHVVTRALADPKIYLLAVDGQRFRRDYLSKNIYCTDSVLTQNPKVKFLLAQADSEIKQRATSARKLLQSHSNKELDDVVQLRALVGELLRRVNEQDAQIALIQARLQSHPGDQNRQ